jgi:hypothetical protein
MSKKPATHTADRVTIFLFSLIGYRKYEFRRCSWSIVPFAQHRAAIEIIGIPRRARIHRRITATFQPGPVLLEGWGHPELTGPARHMPVPDFNRWLNGYAASAGVKPLGDFRRHNFR